MCLSTNLSTIPEHLFSFFFFFNDTATTEIYTLSLHDALPIFFGIPQGNVHTQVDGSHPAVRVIFNHQTQLVLPGTDRKSTRLNSSHANISYAVFCLKKKK